MKKFYQFLLLVLSFAANAQIVNIPDANFKAKLLQASAGNQIASSQTPVYNAVYSTWTVSSYNTIDANGDGEIQVSEAQAIKWLNVKSSLISNLTGIEAFTNLRILYCYNNQLSSLNVSSLTNLQILNCYQNQLTSLNVSGLTNLQSLICYQNQLPSLNASNLTNLRILTCYQNQLTGLNVSSLMNLETLNCYQNQLPSLNVSNLTNLIDLDCSNNQLTSLNTLNLTNLKFLNCSNNQLPSLNVLGFTNLLNLTCNNNQLTSLIVSNLTNLTSLYCQNNQLSSLNASNLMNLKYLYCYSNQLTSLNVSGCTSLQDFICRNNQLPSLNVLGLTNLQSLTCDSNQLTSLNVSGLTNLQSLTCNHNQLPSLNVSGLTNLQILTCNNNQLASLNVSGLTNLSELRCYSNQLTSLNVLGCTNLQYLDCTFNQLPSLNVSSCTNLQTLTCLSNQLTSLFIKNGNTIWQNLIFSSNPNLQYICADEEDLIMVQSRINQYSISSTCHVNSYCSFTPGGTFYTINGNNRFDSNNNGCDASDDGYPNLKINISNGIQSGNFIANVAGNYTIPVNSGTYTLTPVLENSSYFNITPTTVTVTFPTQTSPFTQNFCITPNGIHHDLEVAVVPLGVARPGFDVSYKIIYKNKGNQIENASLTFGYNDNVMDFLNSSVVATGQNTGLLSWNLGVLALLQSGTIVVSFNLNSPSETPPLNAGNVLSYTATIIASATDETSADNVFALNQPVVNAYDPNDKTCLEGSVIDPSKIGSYVHYQIRFENTGTYPAQNIVVKDMIDTSKFDISTLQIIDSSHPCYAKITGNKVEFIFENINLSFDDATNDGYVVFKIKSLSTLAVNSTVSNSASIYFDYNFPIITNTAISTYQLLNASSFVFENEFVLYPNPVKDKFTIKTKNSLEIQSIEIYNTLGQIVLAIPKFTESVDVSSLQIGTYLVKVNTERGSSGITIIKE